MTTLETMYAPQVNSPATSLSGDISASATSIPVLNGSVLPAAPMLLVIGGDTENAETVRMTAKAGNVLTVVRGVQGTARAWSTGATIARLFTAQDLSALQNNVVAINNSKAEAADLAAAEQRIDDVYAASASGPIANFYRTAGGLPVDDLTIDITPVQAGTGDPSPTNVRAISGWTGANVYTAGKNLFDGAKVATTNTSNWDVSFENNVLTVTWKTGYSAGQPKFSLAGFPVGTYVVSFASQTRSSSISLLTNGAYTKVLNNNATFTIEAGNSYDIGFTSNQGTPNEIVDLQIEAGSVASSYTPYSGSAAAISWQTEAGTVYGGTLNVTTGVLTVTHAKVSLDGTQAMSYTAANNVNIGTSAWAAPMKPGTFYSDPKVMVSRVPKVNTSTALGLLVGSNNQYMYLYHANELPGVSSGATLITYLQSNPIDVTYPLATPLTYQLTPTQVTSLLGENNVWADTGDVYVQFGADIKSYIDSTTGGKQDKIFASGILKGNGSGGVSAAVPGTDYQAPLTPGTDYQTPIAEEKLQYYGVCSTSASTQTKTVTIDGITALTTGLEIRVKMTNAQTYNGTPKLNVNSLGAKNIMQHGSTAAVRYQWQAGEIVSLTYDGTYWVLENNSLADTTYFGLTRLSSATNSTLEDCAATPLAVKTAYDLAAAAVPNTEKGTSVATLAVVEDSTTPTVPRLTPAQGFAPIFEIDSDTTLAAKHAGGILVCTNSPTITIPVSVFDAATEIEIFNYGTGIVTVAGASGVFLNGANAGSKQIKDQYTSGVLLAISSSQWVIQGAIE